MKRIKKFLSVILALVIAVMGVGISGMAADNESYKWSLDVSEMQTGNSDDVYQKNGDLVSEQIYVSGLYSSNAPGNPTKVAVLENYLGYKGKTIKLFATEGQNLSSAVKWSFANYNTETKNCDTPFVFETLAIAEDGNVVISLMGTANSTSIKAATLKPNSATGSVNSTGIAVGENNWVKIAVAYTPNANVATGGTYKTYINGALLEENTWTVDSSEGGLKEIKISCNNKKKSALFADMKIYAGTYDNTKDVIDENYTGNISVDKNVMITDSLAGDGKTVAEFRASIEAQSTNTISICYDGTTGNVKADNEKMAYGDVIYVKPKNGESLKKFTVSKRNYVMNWYGDNLTLGETDTVAVANKNAMVEAKFNADRYYDNTGKTAKAYAVQDYKGNLGKALKVNPKKSEDHFFDYYFNSYDSTMKRANYDFVLEFLTMAEDEGRLDIQFKEGTIKDGTGTQGNSIRILDIGPNGGIKVGDGGTTQEHDKTKWTKIAIEYKQSANKAVVWADGVKLGECENIRSAEYDGIWFIRFRPYNPTENSGTVYLDDIEIYKGSYNPQNDLVSASFDENKILLNNNDMYVNRTFGTVTVGELLNYVASKDNGTRAYVVYNSDLSAVKSADAVVSEGDMLFVKPVMGNTIKRFTVYDKPEIPVVKSFVSTVNGAETTEIASGVIKAVAQIVTFDAKGPELIACVYDAKGVLTDAKTVTGTSTIENTLSIADATGKTVKFFILNSFENIKPLSDKIEVK